MIEEFIKGNRSFIKKDFEKDRARYDALAVSQSPKALWIGCADSRVEPERIIDADAGELFVHRNIANIVPVGDWNFAAVLEYAVAHLRVPGIVICGHSECGGIKALDKEMDDSYIPLWIDNAREAKRRVDARIAAPITPEESKNRLTEMEKENIRLQIEHLRTYPIVKRAEAGKKVEIYGVYYDLATGLLEEVK
ncbi:carbonic anhydrase [Methanocalculus alkaliphilus]|uniref:carbonic anhydrase n=1 Tax=Methanocalculus alkaliphilus TaxID=768730 RepID=UPI0020A1D843|nr:carbonic anhydrase [Methanocalculus alkaliphilus]MCP1715404.1 carbonic anhydrase [Methanocalculus alkaliphilus]